jgi:catechol 2,3-dioxygenase-like lactoylglutathione lyase family enzyme
MLEQGIYLMRRTRGITWPRGTGSVSLARARRWLAITLLAAPAPAAARTAAQAGTLQAAPPASIAQAGHFRGLPAAAPDTVTRRARVHDVAAPGFTVTDMERSLAFFTGVLSFEKISDTELAGDEYERLQGVFPARLRVVRLRLGSEEIELTEYLTPAGRPVPVDMKSNDRAFQHIAIVVRDMAEAYRLLRQHRVAHVSSGPQRLPDWNPNAGGIEAFYFRDPDHHVLEVIAYPPGKGDPRWQQAGGPLFLGIDHTAIVVSDTEASLRFYRDVLGLRVAGESENWGLEQERLNAVFGARLRITALRADRGPGIEFLEYLTPRDGRPMPVDERASDVFHWQTRLVTRDAEMLAERVRAGGYRFVSPGIIATDGRLGFARGLLVRDPDGHVMQIVQH